VAFTAHQSCICRAIRLDENRTAITKSVREFRTRPVKRPRPDRAPRIQNTEQNIIEIGSWQDIPTWQKS